MLGRVVISVDLYLGKGKFETCVPILLYFDCHRHFSDSETAKCKLCDIKYSREDGARKSLKTQRLNHSRVWLSTLNGCTKYWRW